jgi:hypothetical protein
MLVVVWSNFVGNLNLCFGWFLTSTEETLVLILVSILVPCINVYDPPTGVGVCKI